MKKIAIFGAGNIGRSFIRALFCRGGYKVTFIDTDKQLDIILAENVYKGKEFFFNEAQKNLPEGIILSEIMGIIECSIGKMVPLM